ncbi:MAG TPA: hypothetical protein EYH01_00020 [Campylobacterales bacterium]|nr:hypothetical protein [Campylobacterales bacterium]
MKFFKTEDEVNITPVIEGFKCKALVFGVFFGLVILPVVVGLYVGYVYDWVMGIGVVLFLYIVSSIIGSKLRLSSLPSQLRERSLSSLEIARWYVHQHHCF